MAKTLKDAQIVVIPAGVPRKPGVSLPEVFFHGVGLISVVFLVLR